MTDEKPATGRSPAEAILDLLFFAPLGATIEFWEHLPDFARVGRDTFHRQRPAARMIGEFAVRQGRRRLEQSLFGGLDEPATKKTASASSGPAAQSESPGGPEPAAQPESPGGTGGVRSSEVELPIANYDTLSAVQIVPLLAELSPEEREAVRAHEEAHRGRRTVLGKLDQLTRREAGSGG